MKRITFFPVVLILIFATSRIFPVGPSGNEKAAKEACYKSLLSGISSDNKGLQSGCAFMLGEVSCDKGVIPLLRILHDDAKEEARILAALSLYKIGDSRGIFAIKQAIRFDDSQRVRRLCQIFYNAYLHKQQEPSASDNIALE